MGDGDPKCKCKKVSRTKIAEQKLVGTLGHWVMGTPGASAKRSAEQKRRNKNGRTKIIHYSESPKEKLVGTVQVQKGQRNKNWWAEQKKVSGTKIGGQNKKKVSRTKIGGRNKKKVSGTKIGGHCRPLGDGDPKCKCKKVNRTKIGEQNKNSRTKIGGWNKKRSAEQKLVSRTKTAEQNLFIIPSHPNKNWWEQCKCKKVSGTKIGGNCQPLGDGDPKCKYKKVSRTKIAEQK